MTSNTPRKNKSNHLGAKLLLTSTALATSLGLWQVFSSKDAQSVEANSEVTPEVDAAVTNTLSDLPPLPTLVPLRSVSAPSGLQQVSGSSANPPVMRQVAVPDASPTAAAPVKKPVIQSVYIDNPNPAPSNGGGGGGGGGKSSGAAKTKSS